MSARWRIVCLLAAAASEHAYFFALNITMYARIILLVLLVVVIAAVLYLSIARVKIGGADLSSKSGGGDARGIILCIPGLGNGAESFDWPRVSPEIPDKIGVKSTRSLRDELTALGWDVRTFDQPDEPGATIADYCDWIEQNIMRGDRPDIIMGHSAGAHVANYYAATRHARAAILLDPTPKFIYDTLRGYKRHLENPAEPKFAKTAHYLWMYTENPAQNLFNVNTRRVIIYSDDDSDPRAAEKITALEAIPAESRIRVKNATHWVHVTHPDKVLAVIREL